MEDKEKEILNYLFKKWEFVMEGFKYGLDLYEKRNKFTWLIQGALFIAWYNLIQKGNIVFNFVSLSISLMGVLFGIISMIITKNTFEESIINEIQLAEIEKEWSKIALRNGIPMNLNIHLLEDDDKNNLLKKQFKLNDNELNQSLCNIWSTNIYIVDRIDNFANWLFAKYSNIRMNFIAYGSILPKIIIIFWCLLSIISIINLISVVL